MVVIQSTSVILLHIRAVAWSPYTSSFVTLTQTLAIAISTIALSYLQNQGGTDIDPSGHEGRADPYAL